MILGTMELKKALKELAASVEKKDQSQMAAYLFFEKTDSGVKLITCNGETYTEVEFDATASISFDVNFKEFKKFIDAAKGDHVEFILNIDVAGKVKIVSENGSIVMDYYIAKDSDIERVNLDFDSDDIVSYDGEILVDTAIYDTIDKNNPKFELNGLYVSFKDGQIASTDTRRLAISKIDAADIGDIIIPKDALKKGSVLTDLKISDKDHIAHFKLDGIQKRSRLIYGRYPDVNRIVPLGNKFTVMANGLKLQDTLKGYEEIEITMHDGLMEIKSLENGAKTSIECSYSAKVPFKFAINAKYISDAIIENKIEMHFNGNNVPIMLINKSNGAKTIIMPIILNHSGDDHHRYDEISFSMNENRSSFEYSEAKPKAKRVNKDAIIKSKDAEIAELKAEIDALKAELEKFHIANAAVKKDTLSKMISKSKKIA